MLLPLLVLIFVILFGIWLIFSFYQMAVLALVNLVIAGMIVLRMIHDFKTRKGIALYLVSLAVSVSLIMLKDKVGLDAVSRILSKFMIIGAVQMLMLVFLLAQIFLIVEPKLKKQK